MQLSPKKNALDPWPPAAMTHAFGPERDLTTQVDREVLDECVAEARR